jgi:hypothetical protein
VTVRAALPHLVALALGGAGALLASCGGSSAGLIPAGQANTLDSHLQAVANAVDARDCDTAVAAVGRVAAEIASLSHSVDVRLRLRLKQGTSRLVKAVPVDCVAPRPTTTTTTATEPTTATTTKTEPTTATDTTPTTATDTTPTIPTIPTIPTDTTGGAGAP